MWFETFKAGGFVHLNLIMKKQPEESKLRLFYKHPGIYKIVRVVEGKWDDNRGNVLDAKRMGLYE